MSPTLPPSRYTRRNGIWVLYSSRHPRSACRYLLPVNEAKDDGREVEVLLRRSEIEIKADQCFLRAVYGEKAPAGG